MRLRKSVEAVADATVYPLARGELPVLRERLSSLGGVERVWSRSGAIQVRLDDGEIAGLAAELIAGGLPPLRLPADQPDEYVISFCDPNATKALHVGHMRSLALGAGLGSLLEAAAAKVLRQSIVCDCGMAMAEACAGYASCFPGETPASQGLRPDQFVGRCYSGYAAIGDAGADEPDHDSRRTVDAADDLALRYLRRMHAGDPSAERLRRGLREWVIEGHLHTFERLGIGFERLLFESDSLGLIAPITEAALARGLFLPGATEGSVALVVAADVPVVPMIRADGFATGYLRHFAIWHELQRTRPSGAGYINILGNEWTAKAIARERGISMLLESAFDRHYRRVDLGMVSADGRTIKSHEGDKFLIEDCLDWIAAGLRPPLLDRLADRDEASASILKAYFLARRSSAPIGFSPRRLLDPRTSPGLTIVTALAGREVGGPRDDPRELRYAVCRALELRSTCRAAILKCELVPVIRYLVHLAAWLGAADQGPVTGRMARHAILRGARDIGLVSAQSLVPESG